MKSLRPTAEVPQLSWDLGKGTGLKFGDEPYQPTNHIIFLLVTADELDHAW